MAALKDHGGFRRVQHEFQSAGSKGIFYKVPQEDDSGYMPGRLSHSLTLNFYPKALSLHEASLPFYSLLNWMTDPDSPCNYWGDRARMWNLENTQTFSKLTQKSRH